MARIDMLVIGLALCAGACGGFKDVGALENGSGSGSGGAETSGDETGSDSGSTDEGPSTGDEPDPSSESGAPAVPWAPGEYFVGELGEATNGPRTLAIAADGTYMMDATDCDYGVGSAGTWAADGDGISLVSDTGDVLWFLDQAVMSIHLTAGEDCTQLVATIVDLDGDVQVEPVHRGEWCADHQNQCCQGDDCPQTDPGVLEHCDGSPPPC